MFIWYNKISLKFRQDTYIDQQHT